MDGLCHKDSVGPKHKPAQLRAQGHIPHPGRDENLLVGLSHALADNRDVIGLLIRPVGNAHAAGQVDKGDVGPCLLLKLHRQLKENPCQHRIIFIGHRIAGQKSVDAEMLRSLGLQGDKCLPDLLIGHAVLGIPRIVHNIIADLEHTAGIVAAADGLGNIAQRLLQAGDMGDIVQVDDGAQLPGIGEFLRGRVVG